MSSRTLVLRLYLLGRVANRGRSGTLISFAEFEGGRAVERINLTQAKFQRLTRAVRDLRGFAEAGYPPMEETALQLLGGELFDCILPDKVRRLFDRATGLAQGVLPLEICIEDPDIAAWPWEYLYDRSASAFLCQEKHPISRGLFTLNLARTPSSNQGKVCVLLLLGALPEDPHTTPGEEVKWMREVFETELAGDMVELEIVQATDPRKVRMALDGRTYDIVHFFGHAQFDAAQGEGYLRFDRRNGESFRLYANQFAQLMAGGGTRLVFLNACESGTAHGAELGRSAVAAAVLERGVPAVVATQFSIPDTSAHYLSSMLYNALVAGRPLIEALLAGRQAMLYAAKAQFLDWGIPVLYAADPTLTLFPRTRARKAPTCSQRFDKALRGPNMIKGLRAPASQGGPSLVVERTLEMPGAARPKVRVALVDFDAKAGFLPDLVALANRAQSYYHFQLAYLPLPSGVVYVAGERADQPSQLLLPRLEPYLIDAPDSLGVDKVCCLTRSLVALSQDELYFTNT